MPSRMRAMSTRDASTAARKRSTSKSTWSGATGVSRTTNSSRCRKRIGPMPIPGEAAMPENLIAVTSSSGLSELVVHELDQHGERILFVRTHRLHVNGRAVLGGDHHHHDALSVHFQLVAAHEHLGLELRGRLHEQRTGPRVEAELIADHEIDLLHESQAPAHDRTVTPSAHSVGEGRTRPVATSPRT